MPTTSTITRPRIGILGGGGILAAHAPAYRQLADRCTVTVVAEPNPARADAIHDLLGAHAHIVHDYREALSAPDVDAVDVILPHDLHMPATIAAAEAGKPVLVEKVMARNIWECDRMTEVCDRTGVSLTVCHDRRYHPEWRAIKDVVDSGALGRIFFWRLDHNQNVPPPPGHWIRSRDALGGGAIVSCLTHQIDALRWYGGEVDEVACMSRADPERMEGEFVAVVTAGMKGGALAELSINWWTDAHREGRNLWYEMVHVCGTHGEAYMMSGRGAFLKLHAGADSSAVERYGEAALEGFIPLPVGEGTGHVNCIREWIASLRGEPAEILTSGRECRGTVEVAEAAYQAESERRTIRLPIVSRPWASSPASGGSGHAA